MNLKLNLIFTLFAGSILVTSCGQKSSESDGENQISGEVKIDGSSTVFPITEAIAEEFRADQSQIRVTVGMSGTGGGFKKFCRGEIDINDASRPIKKNEARSCSTDNIKYVELTVAYDGLAVIVNPENDWVDHFTVEELRMIWKPSAQKKVTKWSQIRAEWPDEEFSLYGPGVASGTYDYFTEVIVGKSGSSRGDFTASEDDNVLVQGISGDKNSIGFFGLAYFEENKEMLRLVPVKNDGEPILPSLETVKSGEYAPLSRPVFIYVSNAAIQRPAVVAFVDFYLTNAPDLVEDVGYIPLPANEYEKEKSEFKTFVNSEKQ